MEYRVYCGVDFHARQQTISCLTTEDGVVSTHELKHQNKAELKAFYSQFSGPVVVGLEASGTVPGSSNCWKSWVTKSGSATPPRFGGELGGDRKTTGAMPS